MKRYLLHIAIEPVRDLAEILQAKTRRHKWESYAETRRGRHVRTATKRILREYFKKGSVCERVLEIGSGDGNLAMFLLEQEDLEIIPIDISLKRTQRIRHKGLDPVLCDALALPFRSKYFDLVISDNVLEHVSDGVTFLAEQLRVCKREGRIIAITPNKLAPSRFFPALFRDKEAASWKLLFEPPWTRIDPTHKIEYSLWSLTRILKTVTDCSHIYGITSSGKWYWKPYWTMVPDIVKRFLDSFVWNHPIFARGLVAVVRRSECLKRSGYLKACADK